MSNDAPVADDETFNGSDSAIGNSALVVDSPATSTPDPTGPQKTISGNILAGDTDVDSPAPSAVPGTFTSGGGTVVMEADGDFTLLPPAGCASSYSFDYTITDGTLTDTGTVTVAITECVWYVDATATAGGDGRSHSPLTTLTALNGAGGAGDSDGLDDYLFVYGGGEFTTGIVLEGGQRLFGQPHGLSVAGTLLEAAAGTRPNISAVGGTGIALANGTEVQGLTAGTATNFSSIGIRGASITNATIGSDVAIRGNGTGFILQGAATGNVSSAATIVGNTNAAVSVQDRTGGTVTISGDVTASTSTSTVQAINNFGATVNFTGKLALSGSGATALDLRNGGTVSAANAANTITGVTGVGATAVNLDGVTLATEESSSPT